MFDIVITNGLVVDGSGRPATRTDVDIAGEMITAVGTLGEAL